MRRTLKTHLCRRRRCRVDVDCTIPCTFLLSLFRHLRLRGRIVHLLDGRSVGTRTRCRRRIRGCQWKIIKEAERKTLGILVKLKIAKWQEKNPCHLILMCLTGQNWPFPNGDPRKPVMESEELDNKKQIGKCTCKGTVDVDRVGTRSGQ